MVKSPDRKQSNDCRCQVSDPSYFWWESCQNIPTANRVPGS